MTQKKSYIIFFNFSCYLYAIKATQHNPYSTSQQKRPQSVWRLQIYLIKVPEPPEEFCCVNILFLLTFYK